MTEILRLFRLAVASLALVGVLAACDQIGGGSDAEGTGDTVEESTE